MGNNAESSRTARSKPVTTNVAPRSAHVARAPRTRNNAPITAAYNAMLRMDSENPPTAKRTRFHNPMLRPESTGAPEIDSHQPCRIYVPAHGRFNATPEKIASEAIPNQRPAQRMLRPWASVVRPMTPAINGKTMTTAGSNAKLTAINNTSAANQRRHTAGSTKTIASLGRASLISA
ncbi:unannotated protein [freshwater metagenome]|uniref:Unannotated protein n=1 Tax=freshwater metagenome TaxID=449393 RepID=A0A6J6I5B7_9ZZZZ